MVLLESPIPTVPGPNFLLTWHEFTVLLNKHSLKCFVWLNRLLYLVLYLHLDDNVTQKYQTNGATLPSFVSDKVLF